MCFFCPHLRKTRVLLVQCLLQIFRSVTGWLVFLVDKAQECPEEVSACQAGLSPELRRHLRHSSFLIWRRKFALSREKNWGKKGKRGRRMMTKKILFFPLLSAPHRICPCDVSPLSVLWPGSSHWNHPKHTSKVPIGTRVQTPAQCLAIEAYAKCFHPVPLFLTLSKGSESSFVAEPGAFARELEGERRGCTLSPYYLEREREKERNHQQEGEGRESAIESGTNCSSPLLFSSSSSILSLPAYLERHPGKRRERTVISTRGRENWGIASSNFRIPFFFLWLSASN